MKDYSGRKALLIGLARTGLAAAQLLDRLGAQTAVTDLQEESALKKFSDRLPVKTKRFLGGHDKVEITYYNLAVISPGVPWDAKLPSSIRDEGIELISEIELAYTLLSAPIIAVTGSNGKSTTITLIGKMIEAAGNKTYVGGNIGAPLCDAVGKDYDWVVAEVSSFQLEGMRSFRPRIGLVLNISPDHLDRHGTMEVYAALKARLFENQGAGDTLIVNADDPLVCELVPPPGVKVLRFSMRRHDGEGAWVENGMAVARIDGVTKELFAVDEIKITGTQNIENALAAALAALSSGVLPDVIKKVVSDFEGLPHRMEHVAEIDGVTYINDSKGTNVDAAIKSVSGFNTNVVLIAGGSSKGSEYGAFAEAILRHAKGVVLIGETGPAIFEALGDFSPKTMAKDMGEAVEKATKMCGDGDTVLLSPACASFDMFKSFEDRGDTFKAAVSSLSAGKVNHAG